MSNLTRLEKNNQDLESLKTDIENLPDYQGMHVNYKYVDVVTQTINPTTDGTINGDYVATKLPSDSNFYIYKYIDGELVRLSDSISFSSTPYLIRTEHYLYIQSSNSPYTTYKMDLGDNSNIVTLSTKFCTNNRYMWNLDLYRWVTYYDTSASRKNYLYIYNVDETTDTLILLKQASTTSSYTTQLTPNNYYITYRSSYNEDYSNAYLLDLDTYGTTNYGSSARYAGTPGGCNLRYYTFDMQKYFFNGNVYAKNGTLLKSNAYSVSYAPNIKNFWFYPISQKYYIASGNFGSTPASDVPYYLYEFDDDTNTLSILRTTTDKTTIFRGYPLGANINGILYFSPESKAVPVGFRYKNNNYALESGLSPAVSANYVLAGQIAFTRNLEPINGTMTDRGAKTFTPTTSEQTSAAGYYSSVKVDAVTSAIDENIIAENIKKDITILGVTGTHEGGGTSINIYHQTTAPETFVGIWIESTNYESTTIVEVENDESLVNNRINIIRGTNYSTILFDSEVENGLHYKFGGVYITDNEGEVDYDTNIYYGNGTQWIDITPASYEIVPFNTATDFQISQLLKAHYQGRVDLSTIWNVGDTRVIHLDAMAAPVPGSKKAHAAQDMTFRIIGFNHDNLTTSIGNVTKAAVTIECKELLGNYGTGEYDYLSGNADGSSYVNPSFFDKAYRRTWLNNNFVNALPSTFRTLVKEVVKRNLQGHNNTTNYVETNDKAFLLSYPEVFNSTWQYYRNGATLNDFEGTQYAYYNQNNSNEGRKKYVNNNGSASSTNYYYWLRSPSSIDSDDWCCVGSGGSVDYYGYSYTIGLAPALSI